MLEYDSEPPLELFIGEPNRIRQEIIAPPEDPIPGPILDLTNVVYTIRSKRSYTGPFVGVENNPLPHVAGDMDGWYEDIWPESQANELKLNKQYWLHVHAPGHTQRLIPCIAKYRENV